MRVQILSVLPSPNEQTYVHFFSEVGEAHALWLGSEPIEGEIYHVEVGVREPLTWSKDIKETCASADNTTSITAVGNYGSYGSYGSDSREAVIYAMLESWEGDGFTVLRLGDFLMIVETLGDPPPPGTPVRALVRDLTLYDTNI